MTTKRTSNGKGKNKGNGNDKNKGNGKCGDFSLRSE
jgi:hypothetical protein